MAASPIKVLMFPWLAYGHINPQIELAKKLANRGFLIYFCSTSVNLNFIEEKIPEKCSDSIHLVKLQLPETPELPPRFHTTNGLPPHLMPNLVKALEKAKPNFSNILNALKPDLVIYDVFMTWPQTLTALHNIPAVKFSTSSVASFAYSIHLIMKPGIKFPFPDIQLQGFEIARVRDAVESARKLADDSQDKDACPEDEELAPPPGRFCDEIILFRSSREIEGKYLDYLPHLCNAKGDTVSSLFPELSASDYQDDGNSNELIQWLDTMGEDSCVFVSFGSEYFLSKEEMEEIAHGLELSDVNFIWVVRFPGGQKIRPEEIVPDGFLERVKDKGRIVEGWAPQGRILGHPSTGGFVSHCGWNSVLESLEFEVPIIAVPMQLDQPVNARLVVEIGAGLEVERDENGKFDRNGIAKVIKDVVVEELGKDLREKMRDLREKIKLKGNQELDEAVELLTRVVKEHKLI